MIILVAGLPGAGKTYFGERLAQVLNCLYIDSEQVGAVMRASGRYALADELSVYKEMLLQATRASNHDDDILIDATFYHHTMREMFVRLAERHRVSIHVIEIIADEEIILERLTSGKTKSSRDFAYYENIRDAFEEITMPHLVLQSTNSNIESMLTTAIDYIRNQKQ